MSGVRFVRLGFVKFFLLLFISLSRPVLGRGGGFPQTEWLLRTQALSGYNGETNNLGRCFEIAKWIVIFYSQRL